MPTVLQLPLEWWLARLKKAFAEKEEHRLNMFDQVVDMGYAPYALACRLGLPIATNVREVD